MTEFETKLLKLLEQTNTEINNVHSQLYTIDQTFETMIDTISNVNLDVDTSNLSYLAQMEHSIHKINESIGIIEQEITEK
mgnify:FL=1|tara:strand:+ start:58 stop:297 length:240 start_codon:yes stop_codon:yes gene_type:complete